MNKIKKKFFFVIKGALIIIALLVTLLFLYAAFFFDPSSVEKKTLYSQITEEEKIEEAEILKEVEKLKEEAKQELEAAKQRKKEKIKIKTTIKDGLFATVGNKAVTRLDIVNEIKSILILNNMKYSEENRSQLQKMAVQAVIKKNIKRIETSKKDFLKFNQSDVNIELGRLANKINMNVETLKNICETNGLDFAIIENQVKTDLLWNSLIFYLYKDRVSVNLNEIEEQLKLNQNKPELDEYLISEIILKPFEKDKLETELEKIKKKIETDGFENVAKNLSISPTAIKGGDLGWLSENKIGKNFKSIIFNTPIGSITKPIILKDGVLFFKVRNKRKIKKEATLEELKNELVMIEKTKILNMYSKSHYDDLRRSITIKFFDE